MDKDEANEMYAEYQNHEWLLFNHLKGLENWDKECSLSCVKYDSEGDDADLFELRYRLQIVQFCPVCGGWVNL